MVHVYPLDSIWPRPSALPGMVPSPFGAYQDTAEHNLQLVARLQELATAAAPVGLSGLIPNRFPKCLWMQTIQLSLSFCLFQI